MKVGVVLISVNLKSRYTFIASFQISKVRKG
jgi:hypothetical protein